MDITTFLRRNGCVQTCIVAAATGLFFALAGAAQAQGTPPIAARILPGWVQPDGTRVAGLELTLAPGWKTYWRAPGDAGIPPDFDWSGSGNLRAVGITWPTPQVSWQNGMRSIVYKDRVVIPLALAAQRPDAPIDLQLELALGVCSDICIPYTLTLAQPLDTDDSTPTPAIAAALAHQPLSEQEAGVRAATCQILPGPAGMKIEARFDMPHSGGEEAVVFETGKPNVWVSEAQTTRKGQTLIAVSSLKSTDGTPIALDRSALRMTVIGSRYAVDVKGCAAG